MKAQTIPARARRLPLAFLWRHTKALLLGFASACALVLLIFGLDALAAPDDISPGAAFAAVPASFDAFERATARAQSQLAKPSARGTRPEAIH